MSRVLAALLALGVAAPAAAQPGLAGGLTVDLGELLEPIIITAPRNRIPPARMIDPRVNAILLRLLQQKSDARPEDAGAQNQAAVLFSELTTLTGHMMSMRYSELGFLLTEGLAGATDFTLQNELEKVARTGKNPQMRAAALVALGHAKDERFVSLFQEALRDQNLTVRLGALESLILSGSTAALFSLGDAAHNDPSVTVKAMAAAAYWEKGNPAGREVLLRMADDKDWYARAEAVYHLGRLGGSLDYRRLMDMLGREADPIVRAELTLALIRLERFK